MPISGLKITLSSDEHLAQSALDALSRDTSIELGVRKGQSLAAVLDTPDETANRSAWSRLVTLPGIEHVDLTFAAVDPRSDTADSLPSTGP